MNKFIKENWIKIIAVIILLCAVLDNPYGYYQFLRWSIMIIGGYSAYLSYISKKNNWTFIFIAITVLFNPIIPFGALFAVATLGKRRQPCLSCSWR